MIAHTHKPRLVPLNPGGQDCWLMDCGSWVNGGSQFGVIADDALAVCEWKLSA